MEVASLVIRVRQGSTNMNGDIQQDRWRFRLRIVHAVALVLAILAASISAYALMIGNRAERRLAALRAAGYPTNLAELAEDAKLPAGILNAADVYKRAFAAYVPPADEVNVPLLGKATLPDRGQPLPAPMARAIADCLASNQECLALLHEAGRIGQCWYGWGPPDYTAEGGLSLQGYGPSGLLLKLSAVSHAYQGDPNGAVASIEDGFRLGDSLRRQTVLLTYVVRIACHAVALTGLEKTLSMTSLTEQQLAELNDVLTEVAATANLTEALVGERCYLIEMCQNSIMMRMALNDTLKYTDEWLDAARLPNNYRLARFSQIEQSVIHRSTLLHSGSKALAPAMTRVAGLDLRFHAHVQLARAALAIERYRLVNGKLPEQLEALTPQFLKQVPIDPFDGQPIRYKRLERGYLLHSVDIDGQDNGGRDRSEVKPDEPFDWCFIVTR